MDEAIGIVVLQVEDQQFGLVVDEINDISRVPPLLCANMVLGNQKELWQANRPPNNSPLCLPTSSRRRWHLDSSNCRMNSGIENICPETAEPFAIRARQEPCVTVSPISVEYGSGPIPSHHNAQG
jgi:hypothetical protein